MNVGTPLTEPTLAHSTPAIRENEQQPSANDQSAVTQTLASTLTKALASQGLLPPATGNNGDTRTQDFEQQLVNHLSTLTVTEVNDDNQGAIVDGIVSVIDALTDSTYVDTKYLKGAGSDELLGLAKVASSFVLNPHYELGLAVGYGGTHDDCLMRSISYVLAPVNALESLQTLQDELQDKGITTGTAKVKVFSGHNAAIMLNDFDPSIEKNAKAIFSTISKYLSVTRPGLDQQRFIDYIFDSRDAESDFIENNYESAREAVPEDMVEQLERMGRNHGGETGAQNAVAYGLLHPLILGDISCRTTATQQVSVESDNQTGLVSFGGSPEKRFNVIRKAVANALADNKPELFSAKEGLSRLISHAGNKPVYYKADDTDISVLEMVEPTSVEPKYSKSIKKDVALLKNDLGLAVARQAGLITDKALTEKDLSKALTVSLGPHCASARAWRGFAETLTPSEGLQASTHTADPIIAKAADAVITGLSAQYCKKPTQAQAIIEQQCFSTQKEILMTPSPRAGGERLPIRAALLS